MKKYKYLIGSLILFIFCSSSAQADTIRVPIDLTALSTEELLTLHSEVINELSVRGIDSDLPVSFVQNEDLYTLSETDKNIVTISENNAEINDESFIIDLSSGLVARWAATTQDESIMSDKQFIEYFSSLINYELVYISKYSEYCFEDKQLNEYAHAYLNALNTQLFAITEYKGKDDSMYEHYWDEGYSNRAKYIYLINKEYGIRIPSQYSSILSQMVNTGIVYNYITSIEPKIVNECTNIELELESSISNKYLYIRPFNFCNTSIYDFTNLALKINFIDKNDVVVDSAYLVSYMNVSPGETISTNKVSTNEHFSSISYSYSFLVQTDYYSENIEGTIVPHIQYSWDGQIKKNGELTSNKSSLEIQNLTTTWEMNTKWNKTLYVPTLRFDVLNSDTEEAIDIVAKVVFTNQETKQIWDEVTVNIISSSDYPLRSGYSKKAIVYSSVGYKSKITPPVLTADIYINNQLTKTITIKEN